METVPGPAEELEDGQYVLLRKTDDDNYVTCSAKHASRKQRRSRKPSMVSQKKGIFACMHACVCVCVCVCVYVCVCWEASMSAYLCVLESVCVCVCLHVENVCVCVCKYLRLLMCVC